MRWVALALSIVGLGIAPAAAAEPIVAKQDHATILKLQKDAGNIIIGNPAYFDITIEDPRTLILFGRQPGQTNLIIWDDSRREVLNTQVVVLPDRGPTTVRVYSNVRGSAGAMESTYACAKGQCVRSSVGSAPGALSPIGEPEGEGEGGGGPSAGGGGGAPAPGN